MFDLIAHKPVLVLKLKKLINDLLNDKDKSLVKAIDLTFGSGNYCRALLECGIKKENIIAIDRDPSSLEFNEEEFNLFIDNFSNCLKIVDGQKFDLIIADLGTSLTQLKSNRGFSFNDDKLDMRMSMKGKTGEKWLRNSSARQISKAFMQNGVSNSNRVASEIKRNNLYDISSLKQANLKKNNKTNPLTKILQAIRIEINEEKQELEKLLLNSYELANEKSILIINSFHSGEEKIVKDFIFKQHMFFRDRIWKHIQTLKPSLKEIADNISIRSVKMKAFRLK